MWNVSQLWWDPAELKGKKWWTMEREEESEVINSKVHALHTNTTASWCCQQIGKWISSNFTFRRCSLGFHWVKYIVLAVVLFLVAFHFYCMEQTNKLIAVTASEIEKKKRDANTIFSLISCCIRALFFCYMWTILWSFLLTIQSI